jgi:hypothetical protein
MKPGLVFGVLPHGVSHVSRLVSIERAVEADDAGSLER